MVDIIIFTIFLVGVFLLAISFLDNGESNCPKTRYIYREYIPKEEPVKVSEFYNKVFTQSNPLLF